jgi:glutamate synthase domain-containing protein 3
MSGGIAYALDEAGDFADRCNRDMVNLEPLDDPDEVAEVEELIKRHAELTGSALAARILADWPAYVARFVKVIPKDYQRMLDTFAEVAAQGLSGDEAVMMAFEMNKNDQARVSGN